MPVQSAAVAPKLLRARMVFCMVTVPAGEARPPPPLAGLVLATLPLPLTVLLFIVNVPLLPMPPATPPTGLSSGSISMDCAIHRRKCSDVANTATAYGVLRGKSMPKSVSTNGCDAPRNLDR